jgi:hypothetical protein
MAPYVSTNSTAIAVMQIEPLIMKSIAVLLLITLT